LSPESANPTAVEVEVVVLPTPPLPPNNSSRAMPQRLVGHIQALGLQNSLQW